MVQRKPLTVHYRRLEDPVGAFNGAALDERIRDAMKHRVDGEKISEHWKLRSFKESEGQADTLLMNLHHDDRQSFFGDLTKYTEGHMQAMLRNKEDSPMIVVEQQLPPDGREYVHSIMYWMAIGNHLFAIQSQSLNTRNLERYFTWLLKEKSGVVSDNCHVILNAKFDLSDHGGDIEDIREIVVGGVGAVDAAPTHFDHQTPVAREVEEYSRVGSERSWGKRAIDVLRAVMSSEADVMALLSGVPDGADLDVSVHIGYKSRKRKTSKRAMSAALRNLPEGEITAVGKGGKITGKDIRLSFPVSVQMQGSLLDPEDVKEKLRSAYDYFVANGKIEP